MQLDHKLLRWRRRGIPLAPVVAHRICEDVAILIECGGGDGPTNVWVAFEAVFGILIPEMEGAIGSSGRESAVLRVEGDGVNGVDAGDVTVGGVLLAVTLEGEVEAKGKSVGCGQI